jgi:hypothetical protein
MMNKALGDISVDDLVISAAALALAGPAEKRDACIESAWGGDAELIRQVRGEYFFASIPFVRSLR